MEFLSSLEVRVTNLMNEELSKEFTIEEVQKALKQMHLTKAPGLDGMSLVFYQKHWHIVGQSTVKGSSECISFKLDT